MTKNTLFQLIELKVEDSRNASILKYAVDEYIKSQNLQQTDVSGSLPSRQDFLKTMIDWHEEYLNAGNFHVPLDHEQSEYLSWLSARLAKVWGNDR